MLRPIVLIPFASEVHGREYYVGILEVFKSYFKRYGIEFHDGIVTSVNDIEAISKKYPYFIPIALILTGGTSRLVYDFVMKSQLERIFIVSHSEHNSLASAISVRGRLENEGISAGLYYCVNPYSIECRVVIDKVMNIARAIANIIGSNIGIIADREREEVDEVFESKFDATINIVSFEEFEKECKNISNNVIDETVKEIRNKIVFESIDNKIREIARLYIALKNIIKNRKFDAITIDCFPYIVRYGITPCIPLALLNSEGVIAGCEADLTSLLGLMLAKYITGRSGWIGNSVSFNSKHAIFAHCTAALDVIENPTAISHFETGKPYAITGEMISDTVTLISIDREFDIATIAKGKIIKSGLLGYATCRTQILVEFDYNIEEIPRYAPTNHHVIIAGDRIAELRDIGYMLGIDVVEYKDMMGY
jgi:L-fucose isomerase-like protein